jgi:hypothetical protein
MINYDEAIKIGNLRTEIDCAQNAAFIIKQRLSKGPNIDPADLEIINKCLKTVYTRLSEADILVQDLAKVLQQEVQKQERRAAPVTSTEEAK